MKIYLTKEAIDILNAMVQYADNLWDKESIYVPADGVADEDMAALAKFVNRECLGQRMMVDSEAAAALAKGLAESYENKKVPLAAKIKMWEEMNKLFTREFIPGWKSLRKELIKRAEDLVAHYRFKKRTKYVSISVGFSDLAKGLRGEEPKDDFADPDVKIEDKPDTKEA